MIHRVDFVSSKGNLQVVNTFHVVTHDASDWTETFDAANPHPTTIADEIAAGLVTEYRALLGTTYMFERISVATVPSPVNPSQVPTVGEHAVNLAGTRVLADEDLPPALCGHITWRTSRSGKSFRGRSYLPPIEKTGAIGSDLIRTTDAYYTAAVAFAEKVLDSGESGAPGWSDLWESEWEARFCVYSRTRDAQSAEPVFGRILTYVMRREVGELRSRRK